MRVVAIMNYKGGVGKTTLTANLGALAAGRGLRVLLLDCAPNFGLVTKTAIVASEQILVPAKADYLSTLGLDYLVGNCAGLVQQFNDFVNHKGGTREHRPIDPGMLGVVFTMVQIYSQDVIAAQRNYIEEVRLNSKVPVLKSRIRNSSNQFADAGETGVPAMLRANSQDLVVQEFDQLTSEVLTALELTPGGRR